MTTGVAVVLGVALALGQRLKNGLSLFFPTLPLRLSRRLYLILPELQMQIIPLVQTVPLPYIQEPLTRRPGHT